MKKTAIEAVKKAGAYLLKHYKRDSSLLSKREMGKHIVTVYDKGADIIIKEVIRKRYPDHNLLSEESGYEDRMSEYTWIVDPLDGTGNYAGSNPFWAVSIALMKNNEVVLGVVYAPVIDELYVAEKGKGSTLNDERIYVSEQEELKRSYLLSCEGGSENNTRISKLYQKLYPSVKDLRKFGSAAIEGCFVASGRRDAYVVIVISPWDVAACNLIVEEAGGKVTKLDGGEWKADVCDLLLSNGRLHEDILKQAEKI
ncbi:MAG: inositol monophosphatase family protein [Candidatus Nanoarchaeia archaeon]